MTSSVNGGGSALPVWSADGKEILFFNPASSSVFAAQVTGEETFAATN